MNIMENAVDDASERITLIKEFRRVLKMLTNTQIVYLLAFAKEYYELD